MSTSGFLLNWLPFSEKAYNLATLAGFTPSDESDIQPSLSQSLISIYLKHYT